MPRVRNGVARFVCAAACAVVLCGGVANLSERHRGNAVGYFVAGVLLIAII